LLALPAILTSRLKAEGGAGRRLVVPWTLSPVRQTDLLVVVMAVLLTVIYLSRLPLHSMITVRYILYTTPLWLYGVARLPPVREGVIETPGRVAGAYGVTAVGGVAVFGLALGALSVAIGEAMQFHALLNLGAAAVLVLVVGGRALAPARVRVEWVATGVGTAAGVTTAFVLLAGLEYFQYGQYVLGVARRFSGAIPVF
jgi:hypothetical protein